MKSNEFVTFFIYFKDMHLKHFHPDAYLVYEPKPLSL